MKTWGPIEASALESAWHHMALAIRFAPISSVASIPDVMLAQAFFFIDGNPVRDDGGFLVLVRGTRKPQFKHDADPSQHSMME